MNLDLKASSHSAFWFALVGALAALVHYAVAVGCHAFGLLPTPSNVFGFCCAFPVSYFGHRYWSFQATQVPHIQALPRFLMVALLGFSGNQTLLLLGLHYTSAPFWLVLGVVMVLIAAMTFVLSRYWAFKQSHDRH